MSNPGRKRAAVENGGLHCSGADKLGDDSIAASSGGMVAPTVGLNKKSKAPPSDEAKHNGGGSTPSSRPSRCTYKPNEKDCPHAMVSVKLRSMSMPPCFSA